MTILSKIQPLLKAYTSSQRAGALRQMSEHNNFPLAPSRWQWNKFKDLVQFYMLLGIIPCTLAITYANVFIGPGTLTEIPEDYVPKYWEYHRNPITRFLARYFYPSPQETYEKFLHYVFVEDEKKKLRTLERKIKEKMAERSDYQAYYYRPVAAKYHRMVRETAEKLKDGTGL